MPTDHEWSDVRRVVEDALDLPVAERASFLDRACPDAVMRAEAERFLRACEQAMANTSFLDLPAAEYAAAVVAEVDDAEREIPPALQAALADRYAIQRELGRGGMATVYLARDERHGRAVAVKVIRPDIANDANASLGAGRFQREIEIAARLSHPHILPLHDSGAAAGLLFYVMPYVEGESLRDRLARTAPLSMGDTVRVLRDVASALAYAHRQGIIHRDIKPANILLNQDGDALVADFGVAKAVAAAHSTRAFERTATAVVLGTPSYMAPEQATGDAATDHRADLYALGVVAYEMLAGKPPFRARAAHELVAAHLTLPPEPLTKHRPDTPAALAELVMRLLAKNPADRPQHAIEVLAALELAQTKAESATPAAPRARPNRGRVLAAGAVLLALAVAAVFALLPDRSDRIESIAVLAFANTNGRAEDEPFSDGLTDELITALSKVPGLKVAGRTSTFALKGKNLSLRTIADTLGVTAVLEGSVRRDREYIRVATQLVDARGNHVLWSDTYEREFRDVFEVQEQIARSVVTALSLRLNSDELPTNLVAAGTDNLEAYQLYLHGRHLLSSRQRESLLDALRYFERASQLDPAYAQAYAAQANVYNFLAILGYARPHDVFPRAKAAATRAIALDSLLAEAHAALAHQLFTYEWKWKEADDAFQRAIALNPNLPDVRSFYGMFLHITGRHEEGLEQLRVARTLDPLALAEVLMGRIYLNTDRPDDAIRLLQRHLELNPRLDLALQPLAHAYLRKQMYPEAVAAMRRASALSGARDSAQLAYIYAASGDTAEAGRVLRVLLDTAPTRYLPPFHVAMAYAGLGDADNAFRWLDVAYEERASFMDGLAVHTGFESIRSDPRFQNLLQRMGLQ